MPPWAYYAGIALIALVAAYAIWRGWRLDVRNAALVAENERLRTANTSLQTQLEQADAGIVQWRAWAQSEGWGHTRVIPR